MLPAACLVAGSICLATAAGVQVASAAATAEFGPQVGPAAPAATRGAGPPGIDRERSAGRSVDEPPVSSHGSAQPVPPSTPVPISTTVPTGTTAESSAPAPRVVGAPTRMVIDGLGVDAPVVPVTAVDGVLRPPDDPAEVGWWAAGAPAGATEGPVVIVGHVDSVAGPGALFRLADLPADAAVAVLVGERPVSYRVLSRHLYDKSTGLPPDIFARGAPRLTLITCGGEFDDAAGSYEQNLVVTAELAD